MTIKRKFELSSDETKRKCINEIIGRLDETLDEKIGVIAAEDILDIVTESIGPDIYNQAVKDAKKILQNRFDDIDVDLDLLKS